MLVTQMQPLILLDLPEETLLKVLSYLDFRQIKQVSRTCKLLYMLAQDKRFPVKELVSAYRKLPVTIKRVEDILKSLQVNRAEYLEHDIENRCRIVIYLTFILVAVVTMIEITGFNRIPLHEISTTYQFAKKQPITYSILIVMITLVNTTFCLIGARSIVLNAYPKYRHSYIKISRGQNGYFKRFEDIKKDYQMILEYYQPFMKSLFSAKVNFDANFIFRVVEKPEELNQALQFLKAAEEATLSIIQQIRKNACIVAKASHQPEVATTLSSFFRHTSTTRQQKHPTKLILKHFRQSEQKVNLEKADELCEQVQSVAQPYFGRLYHA